MFLLCSILLLISERFFVKHVSPIDQYYILLSNPVWRISSLKCKEWTLLESSHYRAMRIAPRGHMRSLPRATIDNKCKRSTSRQWSAFINASTVIKILNLKEPKMLVERVNKTIYINQEKTA